MKIFLDTANVQELQEVAEMGPSGGSGRRSPFL